MTLETKTTIKLSDITAIEFECKDCHMKVAYPVGVFRHPPTVCNCNTGKQWMVHGGDTFVNLTDLGELIRRFGNANNEPYIMRLEIAGAPSASGHASGEKG